MKSNTAGRNTSEAEVTQISKQGLWILIGEKELFLSFEHFPWFSNASVGAIHNMQLLNERHLYWPDLDVDLSLESIEHPERFPLVAKRNAIALGVAFANSPAGVDPSTISTWLSNKGRNFRTYRRTSTSAINGAGVDLMLILNAAADVSSIGSLLWLAYERFIAPKKRDPKDDAGIHISIRRADGTLIKFWIGKTSINREIFVKQFSNTVSSMQNSDDPSYWSEVRSQIENDATWELYE